MKSHKVSKTETETWSGRIYAESVVSQSKEQKTQQGMETGLLHLISKAEMNPNVLHVVKDKAELFYETYLDLLFILMQAFKNVRSVLQSGHVLKKFRNKQKQIHKNEDKLICCSTFCPPHGVGSFLHCTFEFFPTSPWMTHIQFCKWIWALCKSCWGASSGAERNALLAGRRDTTWGLDSSPVLELQKAFTLSVLSLWLSPNDVKLQDFLQMLHSFQPRKQWDVLLLFSIFIFNP